MIAARRVLALLGSVFVIQGVAQLFDPSLITDFANVSADGITGQVELRVIYGGLHIALGMICLWGVVNAENIRPALTAMLFIALGVAIPRVTLGVFYRDFSAYSLLAMIAESIMTLVIVYLLRRQKMAPTL